MVSLFNQLMTDQPILFDPDINLLSSPFRDTYSDWNKIFLAAARLSKPFCLKDRRSALITTIASTSDATLAQYSKPLRLWWYFCKQKQVSINFSINLIFSIRFSIFLFFESKILSLYLEYISFGHILDFCRRSRFLMKIFFKVRQLWSCNVHTMTIFGISFP